MKQQNLFNLDDYETFIPPQFEVINGILKLNEPAQKLVGQYTNVFYSRKAQCIILNPQPDMKAPETFEIVNGEIDCWFFLNNQSFQKNTLKKNKANETILLKLLPQKTGNQPTPQQTDKQTFSADDQLYNTLKNSSPLKTTNQAWISISASEIPTPQNTIEAGKWLIFCDNDKVDDTWIIIAQATYNNQLGFGSKVSTSMIPNDKKVICVYTNNADDEDDIMRVRKALRKLGIKQKLPYKTNLATKQGEYASEGKRISKYYC
jgi:hypothetical protein